MGIVTQKDYVELTNKEIQEALSQYVKNKYGRDVDGKFHIEKHLDKQFVVTYSGRVDVARPS